VICAGLILPRFLGNLERPVPQFLQPDNPVDEDNMPSFGVSVFVPLIPAIIMISVTIANIWLVKGTTAHTIMNFFGSSQIAMFVALLAAFYCLGVVMLIAVFV
jgi:high-affinity gluconate transporter